jgi:hypothetical protein
MQQTTQLLFNLKKDLSILLIDKMEKHEVSLERGKELAQTILDRLPDNSSEEQIEQSLTSLKEESHELYEAIQKYSLQFDELSLQKARINLDVINE